MNCCLCILMVVEVLASVRATHCAHLRIFGAAASELDCASRLEKLLRKSGIQIGCIKRSSAINSIPIDYGSKPVVRDADREC